MPIHCHELPPQIQVYHQFRDDLYAVDGVILYKDRIVIPPSLREARVEASIFWPGITPAVTKLRASCND